MYKYKASVIVPAFNAEQTIVRALDSLNTQTLSKKNFEVIIINDGSEDNTLKILENYKNQNRELNLNILNQSNQGVSRARNYGIEKANGKFLFFLDADDAISEETLSDVCRFFEIYYDDIDIVTYTQEYRGAKSGLHYRYNILTETGIFNINETRSISLSNPNYCIKNFKTEFFDESLKFHEDELFAANIVMKKQRLGYVKSATYYYYYYEGNTVTTRANPIYIFDSSIAMYRRLCERFSNGEKVHPYIQDLIINDFGWKLKQNVLWPNHLDGKELQNGNNQIVNILNKIDNRTILNHANLDKFHKHYFLSIKTLNKPKIQLEKKSRRLLLVDNNGLKFHCTGNEIFITRIIKRNDSKLEIVGFLKNIIRNYTEDLKLYYATNILEGINQKKEIGATTRSIHSYYKCKTCTNDFIAFKILVDPKFDKFLRFYVGYENTFWDVSKIYNFRTSPIYETYSNGTIVEGTLVRISSGKVLFSNDKEEITKWQDAITKKVLKEDKFKYILRKIAKKSKIWLYVDRVGILDNSYYQFKHDFYKRDGINRYYVCDRSDRAKIHQFFTDDEWKNVINFRSLKHVISFLKAEKVLTSFVDEEYFLPMKIQTYNRYYRDLNKPEIIYLQHGVLNAETIHYSNELVWIDKITISTKSERTVYVKYLFNPLDLWQTGMSRFDSYQNQNNNLRKILWVPSWRKYLIGKFNQSTNRWEKKEFNKIKETPFFKSVLQIMSDKNLADELERAGFTMDIKLHPILLAYRDELRKEIKGASNSAINLIDQAISPQDYSIVITDFSSYIFDFAYLQKPIVTFVPDKDQIRAGLSLYNKFFISPEELSVANFTDTSELIQWLTHVVKNNLKINPCNTTEIFEFNQSKKCCENIYSHLIESA